MLTVFQNRSCFAFLASRNQVRLKKPNVWDRFLDAF